MRTLELVMVMNLALMLILAYIKKGFSIVFLKPLILLVGVTEFEPVTLPACQPGCSEP